MLIRAITANPTGYKIYFDTGKLLIIECKDGQYAGYTTWSNYWGVNDATIEEGSIFEEKIINYPDLPPIIKSHLEWLLSEENSGQLFEQLSKCCFWIYPTGLTPQDKLRNIDSPISRFTVIDIGLGLIKPFSYSPLG